MEVRAALEGKNMVASVGASMSQKMNQQANIYMSVVVNQVLHH